MNVYAVIGTTPNSAMDDAVEKVFPDRNIKVGPSAWLVAGTGTAKDISDRLGVSTGAIGSAVILTTAGYFGRAPSNIWEWLKVKIEEKVDA